MSLGFSLAWTRPDVRLVEIRRVSTEEQAKDDRAGLARQAHSIRETAKRLGATIVEPPFELTDVCRENFISTPEWRGIRELIRAPDIHIVVDDPDRFVADFGGIEILAECQRTSTLIHHPGGVLDPSSLDGQLVGVIRAVLAGNELKSIKKRVQGAKEAKRREGIFPSAAISLPTGIAYIRTKGDRKGQWTYTDRIAQVREVWRLVTQEGLTNWRAIGKRTGFSAVTTRNILRNPIYKGWWVLDKKREAGPTPIRSDGRRKDRRKVARAPDEVIRCQVFRPRGEPAEPGDLRDEAVVNDATWESVQDLLQLKRDGFQKLRDQHSETRFTYRGLLWCAACGRPVYGCTKPKHGRSKTRRDWYACAQSRTGASKCPTKYLRLGIVNAAVERLFSTILSDERFALGLLEAGANTQQQDNGAALQSARATVRRLTDQRAKLLDLYLSGAWGQGELDGRRVKLDAERDRAEREVKRLEKLQTAADQANQVEGFRGVLVALREFEFWSVPERRDFLRRVFPKIFISKQGIQRVEVLLPANLFGPNGLAENSGNLTLQVGMTWEQLQPPVSMTEFGLPQKDLYTTGELAQALGLSIHQLRDRLTKGQVSRATQTKSGKPAWSLAEVRDLLGRQASQAAEHRWGMPTKASYTTGDITSAFGITWGQLRYAVERGFIRATPGRDANGHRVWSEADVEAVAVHFGNGNVVTRQGRPSEI